ncbi:MAG: hypothetical protein WCJ30_20000, partial [Deltaproteobacteria bacterium]
VSRHPAEIPTHEYFRQRRTSAAKALSPATQAMLIGLLLKPWQATVPTVQLDQGMGYTSMTVSRAVKELVGAGLATLAGAARTRSLQFEADAHAVWQKALPLLRTGKSLDAATACKLGWASGEPAADPIAAAKALVRAHLEGKVKLAPVDPKPMNVPRFPPTDIGHRSLTIDGILVDVVKRGLAMPLAEGLKVEARGFARCQRTTDMDIGMKNFMQNGPRVPAVFLHE